MSEFSLLTIFVNPVERRLRAGWRLLLHLLLVVICLVPTFVLIGVVIGVMMAGQATAGADIEALAVEMSALPLARILTGILMTLSFVAATWLAGRFLDRRKFADFGLHLNAAWWRDLLAGIGFGALAMAAIFAIELLLGWGRIDGTFVSPASGGGFWPHMLAALVFFIAVGIYEELFSRGYHLRNLAEAFGWAGRMPAVIVATLLSSAVFGVLHAGNPNSTPLSTALIGLAGIMLAMGYLLTGELAIPIGLHIGWNFFQGNVFGFAVSGTEAGATFIKMQETGPDLWTGGVFGPEAGLLGLIAMLALIGLTVVYVRATTGKAQLAEALTPYVPAATGSVQTEDQAKREARM